MPRDTSEHFEEPQGKNDGDTSLSPEVTRAAKREGHLTKVITKGADGKPHSDGSECWMSSGGLQRKPIRNLLDLKTIIENLRDSEAIIPGRLREGLNGDVHNVVTVKKLTEKLIKLGYITRSKNYIVYLDSVPAVMLLDVDLKGMPPEITKRIDELGGPRDVIESVFPNLKTAECLWRRSTSAGLYDAETDERFEGSGGFHIFHMATDGADIIEGLKNAHKRLWLSGFGWYCVSKSGALLERSLIDVAVGSPERLIFEAAPKVTPPLAQDLAERELHHRPGSMVDLPDVFKPLSSDEEAAFKRALQNDARRVRPEVAQKKEAFAARIAANLKISIAAARKLVKHQSACILLPQVELHFADGETCTVAQVLADPDAYFERALLDPDDEDDHVKRFRAMVLPDQWDDGWPTIHSFDSGRRIYKLKYDADAIEAAMQADKPNAARILANMLLRSVVDPTDKDHLIQRAMTHAKIKGKKIVTATIKQSEEEYREKLRDRLDDEGDTPGKLILSLGTPLISAREFVKLKFAHPQGRILHHQQDSFYHWQGTHYTEIPDENLKAEIYDFLDHAFRLNEFSMLVTFDPTSTKVTSVNDALKAAAQLPVGSNPPAWIDGMEHPPACDFLACTNGVLHLPTRTLHPPSPAFFNLNALPYAYDPNAPNSELWLQFLDQVLPNDQEAIDTIQELFGLSLTNDTSYQKIILFVGPTRCGKGTIARVQTAMLGKQNVIGPTLASMDETFGLQEFIGKPLAIISDARVNSRSNHINVIVERLLSISGDDHMTVARKFKDAWSGKLSTRIIVLTNEIPQLPDASTALPGRFIAIQMLVSFYGREDNLLTDKLTTEDQLPGILNWSLDGLDRIRKRGRFIQPASGKKVIDDLMDLGSPIRTFVREHCIIDPSQSVTVSRLYSIWREWCVVNGRQSGSVQWFGSKLHAFFPKLEVGRPRDGSTDERLRTYYGIGVGPRGYYVTYA